MKKLVHVKSLITLALCLMMCFTFFAPASTVQAKKRVVDNVFMYPTDPYSYPTCTGWVPCKKTFTSSKKASKTYVRETAWKVIDTAYLYKAATSRGKVFYTKYKMKQLYRCRMHYKKGSKKYTKDEMDQITIQNMGTTKNYARTFIPVKNREEFLVGQIIDKKTTLAARKRIYSYLIEKESNLEMIEFIQKLLEERKEEIKVKQK